MPRKYLSCVKKVGKKKEVNPYAICAPLKKGYKGDGLMDFVKGLVQPKQKPTASYTKMLNKYGNEPISNIAIIRTPIDINIEKFLNIISLGKLGKTKKELKYDELFHLGMVLRLSNGKNLVVEKTANPTISDSFSVKSTTQSLPLTNYQPNSLTVSQLLERTRLSIGDFSYFRYSAEEYNCQRFLLDILRVNNISSEQAEKFIYQDAKAIFKGLPGYVEKVSRFITDLGSKFTGGTADLIGGRKIRVEPIGTL